MTKINATPEQTLWNIKCCLEPLVPKCNACSHVNDEACVQWLIEDAYKLLKEQEKEIKALKLLLEWAEESDFGFDYFPDEYEKYKNEIGEMGYTDAMIHVARRVIEEESKNE